MKAQDLSITIPAEVMAVPDLTVGERILLAHIAKDSRPSNAALAELMGVTMRGVQSMLRRMRELGYVEAYRTGRARQLFFKYNVERCTKCAVSAGTESNEESGDHEVIPVDPGVPPSTQQSGGG